MSHLVSGGAESDTLHRHNAPMYSMADFRSPLVIPGLQQPQPMEPAPCPRVSLIQRLQPSVPAQTGQPLRSQCTHWKNLAVPPRRQILCTCCCWSMVGLLSSCSPPAINGPRSMPLRSLGLLPGSITLHNDLPLQPPRPLEVMTATALPLFVPGQSQLFSGQYYHRGTSLPPNLSTRRHLSTCWLLLHCFSSRCLCHSYS